MQALLAVLPFASAAVYAPSVRYTPMIGCALLWSVVLGQWYFWDAERQASSWLLCDELRLLAQHRFVRIWVFVADEGSQGWAWFEFMANRVRIRIVFIRDPLHRLSNLFTNSLRGAPAVMTAALRGVTVAHFRRGPFGSGKFWSELKDTLILFLRRATLGNPVIQIFAEDIAKDHGRQSADLSWGELKRRIEVMLVDKIGPVVQLRRWWSVYDAVEHLIVIWHTMFMSLVQFAMKGVDAWKLARETAVVVLRGDSKEAKKFKFTHQVLCTLANSLCRRLLLCMRTVFRLTRLHHKRYTAAATDPRACRQFLSGGGQIMTSG